MSDLDLDKLRAVATAAIDGLELDWETFEEQITPAVVLQLLDLAQLAAAALKRSA